MKFIVAHLSSEAVLISTKIERNCLKGVDKRLETKIRASNLIRYAVNDKECSSPPEMTDDKAIVAEQGP
ncbi:MAG: hypothetical protein A4E63_02822 [Syntrophorhabdus sp. PtaU1.Bin050]|nr:MAG: hypothetical protein A4E63_02822 [Syntrophorhabdus sp. PtaU1.Bin050]